MSFELYFEVTMLNQLCYFKLNKEGGCELEPKSTKILTNKCHSYQALYFIVYSTQM